MTPRRSVWWAMLWSLSLTSALGGELSAPAEAPKPESPQAPTMLEPPPPPSEEDWVKAPAVRPAPQPRAGVTGPEGAPSRRTLVARDRSPRILIESLGGLAGGVAGGLVGALFGSLVASGAGASVGMIGGGAGGISVAIWLAGWANDGDGQYVWTMLGTAAGGVGLFTTAYLGSYVAFTGNSTLAALLIVVGCTLPIVGGVIGYELSSPLSRTMAKSGADVTVWVAPAPGGGASAGVLGTFF